MEQLLIGALFILLEAQLPIYCSLMTRPLLGLLVTKTRLGFHKLPISHTPKALTLKMVSGIVVVYSSTA